jgi:hypothetical protein
VCAVRTVQVNGIARYDEQHGAGTPLLLIGGLIRRIVCELAHPFRRQSPRNQESDGAGSNPHQGCVPSSQPHSPRSMAVWSRSLVGAARPHQQDSGGAGGNRHCRCVPSSQACAR